MGTITFPNSTRGSPLFSGLSEREKDSIIQAGRLRHIKKGQRLYTYGDEVKSIYIVCDGAIQLFRETPDGHEITAYVLIEGDTTGVTDCLQQYPTYHANATATLDTVVLELPCEWVKINAAGYSVFILNLLTTYSQRLQMAGVEIEHKSTMTSAQQVACFLKRLCLMHNFDPHGFDLPYSKTLIASRLGMELETFSRSIASLHDFGINIESRHVSFTGFQKATNFACDSCSIAGDCPAHKALEEKSLLRKSELKVRA